MGLTEGDEGRVGVVYEVGFGLGEVEPIFEQYVFCQVLMTSQGTLLTVESPKTWVDDPV